MRNTVKINVIDNRIYESDLPNNGDNLLFAGESTPKEWPQVGDEVVLHAKPCRVIGVDGDVFWIKKESGRYDVVNRNQLQKPKAPEEELREELINDLSIMQRESNGYIVKSLMNKYNITKKPQ